MQVADEISRRVLDAIAHEPALGLAVPERRTSCRCPRHHRSRPAMRRTPMLQKTDAAKDGCCDFAAVAAPPPEASVTGLVPAVPQPTVPEATVKE
jgi:hypothetical protein